MTPEKAKEFLERCVVQTPGISLQPGEVCYFEEDATAVIAKTQNIGTTYTSSGSGLYYKGLSVRGTQGYRNNVRGTVVDQYSGTLFLTSKRIVLVAYKGGFDFPLTKVTNLTFVKEGLMVTSGGKSFLVSTAKSKKLKEIILANNDYYAAHPEELGGGSRSADAGTVSEKDTVSTLKSYKELLDSGAITQDEYDAKKKEILGGSAHEPVQSNGPSASFGAGKAERPKAAVLLWIGFIVMAFLTAFSLKGPVQWRLAALFGGLTLGFLLHLDPMNLRSKGKMLPVAATWSICILLALAGGLFLK